MPFRRFPLPRSVAEIVAAFPWPKRAKMERSFVTNGVEEKCELGKFDFEMIDHA